MKKLVLFLIESVFLMLGINSMYGCEHEITITAKVTVDAELTQALSEAQPGIVTITAGPMTGIDWIAVICEPSEEDIELFWHRNKFGCAEEATLTAKLLQVNAEDIQTPCGIETKYGENLSEENITELARASKTIFAGKGEGLIKCKSGSDFVEIILQ
ncbi:MAG: hypothetical protein JW841_11495 [Deltaproteobacteria bacterium]|nr:hypothetical protein [Deltaproteobacteria bacterium]